MTPGESGPDRIVGRLLADREEEREYIAKILHDDLGQQVASLSILASILKRRLPESEADSADRIREKLATLGEGMRRLSQHLYPTVLEHAGLVAALRVLCTEFAQQEELRVSFDSTGDFGDLPFRMGLGLFRIVQDVLQSVSRLMRKVELTVRLDRRDRTLHLIVGDSSRSLCAALMDSDNGVAMHILCQRAKSICADLRLERNPVGSQLTITSL